MIICFILIINDLVYYSRRRGRNIGPCYKNDKTLLFN